MAHYIINLPGNMQADVRHGKVFKKHAGLFKQWPWVKVRAEERTGYIVTLQPAADDSAAQYHFLKTQQGQLQQDDLSPAVKANGKWLPAADDKITIAIKKAIDDYENKQ